ncbi:hypothetical protein BDV37DRAFT_279051 [Aspergillus pseudonomiae]|uniref:Fungal-specific transcription factor domain-containing protein n=1 Tax=Aspergillus pseudonomiae TaxID=1506151 RepID=A0A5N7DQ81_9EURO|nr:uncharacterized protein BDV37DRAFT_279051 [Aspergillus pseudonomiae]KAE8408566.1 hypothetical protein BDV37DRAFT_279051 [Aspergillus pseudonomiae]
MASMQGRIYDDIYSPGALRQPAHIRTSHARALASELKTAMPHAQDIHDHYEASKGQVLGPDYHEIAKRSDRVIGLSMLTLIYRSIAPGCPSMSAFCQECIDAARDTLQEHDRCVAVITKAREKTVFLEAYINWLVSIIPRFVVDQIVLTGRSRTITQSPFILFIILFCHIIEMPEVSDLEHMRGLVEKLKPTSNSRAHSTCSKQHRLFRVLYDVAAKYLEVKPRADGGPGVDSSPGVCRSVRSPERPRTVLGLVMGLVDGLVAPTALQNTAFGDVEVEMDLSGAQLWDWFTKNQAIMRMLEDT